MKLQTPKGFRDFLPKDSLKRKIVIDKITGVFAKFGFDPLETPTLEYEETLMGKYGEEERLIYKFETPGGDKVALKYDQTVPLARVIAQYGPTGQQVLPIPFKRYQIQPAYRGENTQKGRYREFLQCDADIVGVSSPLADAEILALLFEIYKELGLKVVLKINDRSTLGGVEPKYLAAIDKLNKIGKNAVIEEMVNKGLGKEAALELFEKITQTKPSENLEKVMKLFEQMGNSKEVLVFDPALIRGLDYYTGLIVEVVLKSDLLGSSLAGGGRYDKMIGKFSGNELPAIGFAIGLDRTIEAMAEQGVLEDISTGTRVLVTVFSPETLKNSVEAGSKLRAKGINSEVWLNEEAKLEKQLKYADQKGIPFAIIIGPEEAEKGQVNLKSLKDKSQETLSLDEAIAKLSR